MADDYYGRQEQKALAKVPTVLHENDPRAAALPTSGIPIKADASMPRDEVQFQNPRGQVVGKIVNVAPPTSGEPSLGACELRPGFAFALHRFRQGASRCLCGATALANQQSIPPSASALVARLREYVQHKLTCITNMSVSNGLGLTIPTCTCGLDDLLAVAQAPAPGADEALIAEMQKRMVFFEEQAAKWKVEGQFPAIQADHLARAAALRDVLRWAGSARLSGVPSKGVNYPS